jgi:hypothetical protein
MPEAESLREADPPALHERALDNLRFIRQTMERAGSFTSIPGTGGIIIGITAIAAAALAHPFASGRPVPWVTVWLIEAGCAGVIGTAAMILKAGRAGVSLTSAPARLFFVSYFAPMSAGAALTLALIGMGVFQPLPGSWLLLYGTAFVSSGAFSLRVIPVMGLSFMALGCCAFFFPLPVANAMLGAGFGVLHIAFGLLIARRYGG